MIKRGTKIITNQGWINPEGAAQRIVHWLRELGAKGVKVAAVSGGLIMLYSLRDQLNLWFVGERRFEHDPGHSAA